MKPSCPYCSPIDRSSDPRTFIKRSGTFRRKSDSRLIKRFTCLICKRSFSFATLNPAYRHKKRQMNERLRRLICSGVSLRRSAKLLRLSRTTVARKLIYLGEQSKIKLREHNLKHPLATHVQFDDQETFEHTKCKPLSCLLYTSDAADD